MKILFFTFFFVLSSIGFSHDFDYEWSNIISKAQNIWDEDDVSRASSGCDDLADDIDEYLNDNSDISSSEKQELKALKKKAEAMEDFINTFLLGRSFPIAIKDFKLCANELGAQYSVVNSSYKVKVYVLSLNGYKCLFSWNDTSTSYQTVCSYSSGSGNSGSYTGQATNYCVRAMTDNRDDKSTSSWRVTSMKLTASAY